MTEIDFLSIVEELRHAGVYLDPEKKEVEKELKKLTHPVDQKAVQAVNEALGYALHLNESLDDLSQAARLLEKIQLASVETERAAFISHSAITQKAFKIARQITIKARELFHEIKEKKEHQKAA